MQSFTVHLKDSDARGVDAAEAAVFVGDKFSVPAFVFGIGWLIYHRLWIALCIGLMLLAALTGLGMALHLDPAAVSALSLLFNLALGLEASQIRRWTLERNGQGAVAVVAARTLDEAEARFFTGYEARQRPAPTNFAPGQALPAVSQVLGMFPQPGGRS